MAMSKKSVKPNGPIKVTGKPVTKSELASAYGLSKTRVRELEKLVQSVVERQKASSKRKRPAIESILEDASS
jgi:hypothetical protein